MMKLTQKRTCFGCKALKYINRNETTCQLGYETGFMGELNTDTMPLEPCPKPMTKDDWNTAQTELRKGAILGKWLTETLEIDCKPELLNALKLALKCLDTYVFSIHPDDEVHKAERQIIEKAIKEAERK